MRHETPLFERVSALDRAFASDPFRYRRRVRAWTRFGIAIYLGLVAIALGSIGAAIARLLGHGQVHPLFGVFGGIALYGLAAGLLARADAEGVRVPVLESDAPELWAEVDRLRERLGAPPIDDIGLDFEFNASVRHRTRFLLFGGGPYELRLGLPLILACDPDELSAVVAHEIGHFRADDLGQRRRWQRMAYALYKAGERFERTGGIASILITPIARWYVSHLGFLLLPLMRESEREADRAIVEVGLEGAGIRELVRTRSVGTWYDGAFLSHRPTFAEIRAALERPLDPVALERTIRTALHERPDPTGEHPTFGERLATLGVVLRPDDAGAISALAVEVARHVPGEVARPWDTLFTPEFRPGVETRMVERDARPVPPADAAVAEFGFAAHEAATELARGGDEIGAQRAFLALAGDPAAGPFARLEAARMLLILDEASPEAVAATAALGDDPYVGLDAAIALAERRERRYHEGYGEATEAELTAGREEIQRQYDARFWLIAAIHQDPGGTRIDDAVFPADVLAVLPSALGADPRIRRAWAVWAGHRAMPGGRSPLLILDLGIRVRAFRIARPDPKTLAESVEAQPILLASVPLLAARSERELARIVGDRPPFWTAPDETKPGETKPG